jgi:hypothetical protein
LRPRGANREECEREFKPHTGQPGTPTKVAGRAAGDRIGAQVTRGGKTSRYIGTRAQTGKAR